MTDLDGLLAHIAAALGPPDCCPTGTDTDWATHTTDCPLARCHHRYLAWQTRNREKHMPIIASLLRAAERAGLDVPDIRRDTDNPSVLLVKARPVTLDKWSVWLNLVNCPADSETTKSSGFTYAKGTWAGCRVILYGHGVPALRYAERVAEDPTLPPFGSPITS